MDHADVRAWLDEAFFTPGALDADEPTALVVRDHLASCPDCSAHAAALRRTALMLDLARGPSPQVRDRVMATVRRVGRPARVEATVGQSSPRWAGLRLAAAVLVVGIISASLGVFLGQAVRPPDDDGQRLASAVEMMSSLAARPSTHQMVLRDAVGGAGGVALMSVESHEIAIFTSGVAASTGDGEYHCYLEHEGEREWIGLMRRAGGIGFWAGHMEESMTAAPDDQLVIALDDDAPAVLSGRF